MATYSDFGSRSVDRLGTLLNTFLTSTGLEREKARSIAHLHFTSDRWRCSGRAAEVAELHEMGVAVHGASTGEELASVVRQNVGLIAKAGLCDAFKLAPEHCAQDLSGHSGVEATSEGFGCGTEPFSYADVIPWETENSTPQKPGDAHAVPVLREGLAALSTDTNRARDLLNELVLTPMGTHDHEVLRSLAAGALMKLGVHDHASLAINVLTMRAPPTSSRGFDLVVRQIQADVLVAMDRRRADNKARLLRPEDVIRQTCDSGLSSSSRDDCVNAYYQSFCADLGLGCERPAPP